MDRRIIALYDEYTHAPLPRREFLDRLARLAGGTAAAYALLPMLENNYATAQTVAADDPAVLIERTSVPAPSGAVAGYLARPTGKAKAPAVIVIHENRGLNPHIEDVARRFAKAGFVTLAPDLLTALGGTPTNEDAARDMITKLDQARTVEELKAVSDWLAKQSATNGKVGVVGFCWGGGMANQMAIADPTLDAVVVFYGRSPDPAKVSAIKAPLMMHYAGLDQRVNETVPDYLKALDAAGKDYTAHRYDGADHAFHNDTNAARYNKEAADLAWERTVAFLRRRLA